MSATTASAAPMAIGSRPIATVTPIEQVRVVCDQRGRCWNTRRNNGAAVGAAIGLGILGAAGAAAAASQGYYAAPPPPGYGPGYYGRRAQCYAGRDMYGRPLYTPC